MGTIIETNLWKNQRQYVVQIRTPRAEQNEWPVVAMFGSLKAANRFEQRLQKTLEKATKQAERGKGDTSDPDADADFQVQQRLDKKFHVVHRDGGDSIGIYETREEANVVANALNEEVETVEQEEEDCVDPEIWRRGRGGRPPI